MSMAPMDKDTVIDIIAATVSFIPFYGEFIENGITVVKGFRKLFKDASNATQIIEKIQAGVHCGDLSEEDAKSVCVAIQGVLRDKQTDFQKIARDDDLIQKLKNDIFKASDHRKDAESQYQEFISETVECMLSPEILPLFADCDQIAVENLHEIRALLKSCNLIFERLEHLETRMTDIEQNMSSKQPQSKPDNQEYLERFDEPLFLEDDNSKVTLASMYVSPHISGKQDTAADCIMTWFDNKKTEQHVYCFSAVQVSGSLRLFPKSLRTRTGTAQTGSFPCKRIRCWLRFYGITVLTSIQKKSPVKLYRICSQVIPKRNCTASS